SNRNLDEITIIGVTKYVTIERAKETIEAGITNLGENRLEGFLEKHENIQDSASWHFIGTLQSRKVKEVIGKVDAIHSLDRRSLAKARNKGAATPVDCYLQVDLSGEETKHGFVPEDTRSVIGELEVYNNTRLAGLMPTAPHIDDEEQLRNNFRPLASLRE